MAGFNHCLYHPLSGSPYCVLKGECQKSQSIRESMHKLWIVVEKINMWSLNQKVSGLIFVSPDIPAFKYGRTMEEEAVNAFYNEMSKKT